VKIAEKILKIKNLLQMTPSAAYIIAYSLFTSGSAAEIR